ncbi:M48 family metallopeptidase [Anthocerotibacter panamensis]|uniref:M48 family metallopeptidase n=1 Tax=Anthocerotibacter panamensis TaxID=2857077 RepID=UPI001C4069B1|nr:M48 family metallopeptidase [Anthocerotibacter panamensis]
MRGLFLLITLLVNFSTLPALAAAAPWHEPHTLLLAKAAGVPEALEEPVKVPEPSAQAMRYYHSGNILWIVTIGLGLLVPAVFLFSGFSARIRTWATKLGRKRYFILVVYLVIFNVLNGLLNSPLDYYSGYLRPHEYGLSNQSVTKWMQDWLIEQGLSLGGDILLLWIPYLLLAKSPKRWWLYTGLAAVPVAVVGVLIAPIWISPLFNHFGPMKDHALEAKIQILANQAGIEGSRIFEVDKSVDTKTLNAYVTGLGDTKRIVLWDTIIARLQERELLFVMGHEMGHYVLGHVFQTLFFAAILLMVSLYGVHRMAWGLVHRFKRYFGFDQLADVASFPLLLLLLNVCLLVTAPISLGFSRYLEHEADRFGLEITHDNRAAAAAFVKLQQGNLSNPRPDFLYLFWRSSHPSIGERIDFANTYRPWEKGEPLQYGHLFKTTARVP